MVWFAKFVVLIPSRGGRGDEKRDVVSVPYLEVTALFDAVENDVSYICVRCSTSDEIVQNGSARELKHRDFKVG